MDLDLWTCGMASGRRAALGMAVPRASPCPSGSQGAGWRGGQVPTSPAAPARGWGVVAAEACCTQAAAGTLHVAFCGHQACMLARLA